jgi:outer membrane biosynthesis protein TonB
MTCHEARELFSARFDERLADDEAARLGAHLAGCDDCRLEWARFERVVSLTQSVEPSRAPAGFVDRVLEAVRPVPWPLRLLRQVFTPMQVKLPLEAAALLLVGGLAVMTFQRSPEMQRVARQEYETPPAPSPQNAVASRDAERPTSPSEARPRSDTARPLVPAPPLAPAPPQPAIARQPETAPAPPPIPQTAIAPSPARSPAPQPAPATPPAPAPQSAPSARPSVAQELRRDTTDSARRESAAKTATAPPAAAPLAARARPPGPDVSAWLTVADRAAALTALAETVTRVGGRENARRAEGRADVVEVAIPRDAYDSFIREVSRLGGFAVERQTPELPASVSVSLRITD